MWRCISIWHSGFLIWGYSIPLARTYQMRNLTSIKYSTGEAGSMQTHITFTHDTITSYLCQLLNQNTTSSMRMIKCHPQRPRQDSTRNVVKRALGAFFLCEVLTSHLKSVGRPFIHESALLKWHWHWLVHPVKLFPCSWIQALADFFPQKRFSHFT